MATDPQGWRHSRPGSRATAEARPDHDQHPRNLYSGPAFPNPHTG